MQKGGVDFMYKYSYIEGCLYGNTEIEEIEEYVSYWHEHELEISLKDFLGMTQYEYQEWVKYGNSIIRDILRSRMDNKQFEVFKHLSDDEKVAARCFSIEMIEELKKEK